jgi:glycine oxidase
VSPSSADVVVIGAGLPGLAVARAAADAGASVVVLDRGRAGEGASHVAAGMLAPVAEADPGERALLALGLESARRWPAFATALHDATGVDPELRRIGTLVVARDRDAAEALVREAAIRDALGAPVSRLTPSRARRLEPALAPSIHSAVHAPDDHAVDPRAATRALRLAAGAAGAQVREHVGVREVVVRGGRAVGVVLDDGTEVPAAAVVLAAGAWAGGIAGLPDGVDVPVRPVKGQLLRLRPTARQAEDGEPPLIGCVVRFDGGYLVPRGDGCIVLGATTEERGFDTEVTALATYELLRDAAEVVPGVLELAIDETLAGLRPATPDNAPLLGEHPALPGFHLATGHHRGGVLLAPVTADLLVAGLTGRAAEDPVPPAFAPDRFATARAAA